MAFLILSSIFIGFLTFTILIIYRRVQIFKIRSKIGLDGPETHWFWGNMKLVIERIAANGYNDSATWHQELHRKYGKTFGIYFGTELDIVLSDEEDIKEVFIKNFSNFSNRITPQVFEMNHLNLSLLQNSYSTGWKHTRSAIAPIFATGKMKAMHETINSKIDIFLDILKEKSIKNEKWDIFEDFQKLSLDIIGKCAFAIDSDCQRDQNDVFYMQAREFVSSVDIRKSWILKISFMLPELSWLWKSLYRFSGLATAELPLVQALENIYERRLTGEGSDSIDLLKLLLDRGMSKQEVVENCFAFLIAGYETSSTAMIYCAYLLAKYPDVQEKLYQEIVELKRNGKKLNYDSIHQLNFVNRVCLNDIIIRGQFYPKGAVVKAQPYTLHRLESNWENPDEFDPERFLNTEDPTKDGLKWIPFGVGPRYCVGMRFAEMEFKTTIAKLIEMFQLSIPDGEADMVPECNGIIIRPKGPVRLELKLRS
ncbi:hypothetical protein CAEBREN_11806 [Caenorhabditis brenneri]|uniref:CYtochrome P450 family n=1 Tax=Caenorhabditis brenneri TaxID=135651 RepID=G0NI74_CAEBE|nr:hypothetical protein CAEBREN_11806 [Caenorhabditis brenneri]